MSVQNHPYNRQSQRQVTHSTTVQPKAAFFAFAAALFFAFFSAFLLAGGSTKLAPGGPEVCPTPELGRADTAPGGRYLPGPASSGEAFARLKFPDPLVACGGRYGAGLRSSCLSGHSSMSH